MNQKDLDQLSIEELQVKIRNHKLATSILLGLLIVLFSSIIYMTFTSGSITPMLAVPIVLTPLVVMNFKKVRMMQDEIGKRSVT